MPELAEALKLHSLAAATKDALAAVLDAVEASSKRHDELAERLSTGSFSSAVSVEPPGSGGSTVPFSSGTDASDLPSGAASVAAGGPAEGSGVKPEADGGANGTAAAASAAAQGPGAAAGARDEVVEALRAEVAALRASIDALHVRHRELTDEAETATASSRHFEEKNQELSKELSLVQSELELKVRQYDRLKQQAEAAGIKRTPSMLVPAQGAAAESPVGGDAEMADAGAEDAAADAAGGVRPPSRAQSRGPPGPGGLDSRAQSATAAADAAEIARLTDTVAVRDKELDDARAGLVRLTQARA